MSNDKTTSDDKRFTLIVNYRGWREIQTALHATGQEIVFSDSDCCLTVKKKKT